jgi:outer membrane lipoprotein-sorting protein
LGKENINGTDAFKLKLLTKDGIEFTYLVDPATYYILRSTVRLKNGEHLKTTSFSDYRKTDEGLVMPFAAEFTTGNSNLMYLIVNKVEINKDIDPEVFKMPK